jgi:hypothetical protein
MRRAQLDPLVTGAGSEAPCVGEDGPFKPWPLFPLFPLFPLEEVAPEAAVPEVLAPEVLAPE